MSLKEIFQAYSCYASVLFAMPARPNPRSNKVINILFVISALEKAVSFHKRIMTVDQIQQKRPNLNSKSSLNFLSTKKKSSGRWTNKTKIVQSQTKTIWRRCT